MVGDFVGVKTGLEIDSNGEEITGEHSPSLRKEMTTEQCESTVISTPVTMILAPPPTQSSIIETRESLPLSEVPSSLARYVRYEGDSL